MYRLDAILGMNYRQQINLLFADPAFDRVIGTLRAVAGDVRPEDLERNGLGYNNLLSSPPSCGAWSERRTLNSICC